MTLNDLGWCNSPYLAFFAEFDSFAGLDLGVTWVCVHDLTWHQNDLKVD